MAKAAGAREPQKLGRYELLFRIASGGMAEVHAARVTGEAGFQKLVAVKCMLPSLADDDEFVQMFLDEARLAANISSPYVVQTFDLGRHTDGSLYIVMELVVGTALSRLIRSTRKRESDVPLGVGIEILAQAADGLHDAHEASTPIGEPLQIVHRDISPQNILVGLDGRIRITDFGVARAVMRLTQTVAGKIKGKFAYSSPEQLGEANVDRRSDIFSLGIVAWETITGRRLFVGEHPMQTIERVKNMAIPAVHELRPDVPTQVSVVVAKALSRDVDRRYRTAREFGLALREAARSEVDMPTTEAFRAFVEHSGGEQLRQMRTNIKRALSNDSNFESFRESAEISQQGTKRVEDSNSGIVIVKSEEESSLPISVEPPSIVGAPGSQPPTTFSANGKNPIPRTVVTETTAIRGLGNRVMFGALLAVLAVAVGGGTWWLLREPEVTPSIASEPRNEVDERETMPSSDPEPVIAPPRHDEATTAIEEVPEGEPVPEVSIGPSSESRSARQRNRDRRPEQDPVRESPPTMEVVVAPPTSMADSDIPAVRQPPARNPGEVLNTW